jgi:hypothetical protein
MHTIGKGAAVEGHCRLDAFVSSAEKRGVAEQSLSFSSKLLD